MVVERKSAIRPRQLEGLYDLARRLREGSVTPMDYLSKLEGRFSQVEPLVEAFLPEIPDRFQRLRCDAENLEARWASEVARPLLYGVPVAVKDIFRVDGFPTFAGSRLPGRFISGPEACAVRSLRDAGSLILGKSVTTEFAYFAPGPTKNPHDLGRTPGGSSSGSAAAVACGLAPLALGTQTIGSIIRPAAFCGVIGFKPTYGRVSQDGVVPLAPSVDHVGFFCRDIEGAELAASILCRDWEWAPQPGSLVLGIPEGPYLQKMDEKGIETFRQAVSRLSESGCDVVNVEVLPDFDEIARRHMDLVSAEAASVHEEWFERFRGLYHPKTVELIMRGRSIPSDRVRVCRDNRYKLRDQIHRDMERLNLSAWLAPAALGPGPKGLDSTGDPVMNLPWTHAGLPVVNLPVAKSSPEDMPLGIQVIGRWLGDEKLLALARNLEKWSALYR